LTRTCLTTLAEFRGPVTMMMFATQGGYADVKKTLFLVGLVFAIYFPIAWHLQRTYVPIKRPPGGVAHIALIVKEPGTRFAYYGSVAFKPPRAGVVVLLE